MKIGKSYALSYGHRLQRHPGKCRNLHGHNAKIDLMIGGEVDTTTGMVQDFYNFKIVFETIDRLFDHKMILEKGDALVEVLGLAGEKFQVIDQPPTAEMLASHCCVIAADILIPEGLKIDCSVKFWETSDSFAYVEFKDARKLVGDSIYANASPTH